MLKSNKKGFDETQPQDPNTYETNQVYPPVVNSSPVVNLSPVEQIKNQNKQNINRIENVVGPNPQEITDQKQKEEVQRQMQEARKRFLEKKRKSSSLPFLHKTTLSDLLKV